MRYPFPNDLRQRVQAQLESGQFATEDDVLREAMGILEKQQQNLRAVQAMVREADEDIATGRVGPFDSEETKQAIRKRLREHGIAS